MIPQVKNPNAHLIQLFVGHLCVIVVEASHQLR